MAVGGNHLLVLDSRGTKCLLHAATRMPPRAPVIAVTHVQRRRFGHHDASFSSGSPLIAKETGASNRLRGDGSCPVTVAHRRPHHLSQNRPETSSGRRAASHAARVHSARGSAGRGHHSRLRTHGSPACGMSTVVVRRPPRDWRCGSPRRSRARAHQQRPTVVAAGGQAPAARAHLVGRPDVPSASSAQPSGPNCNWDSVSCSVIDVFHRNRRPHLATRAGQRLVEVIDEPAGEGDRRRDHVLWREIDEDSGLHVSEASTAPTWTAACVESQH
jgi:hypothetical protein